jgi:hypothetical protein
MRNNQSIKYSINENYFSVIDTPSKAYWLGFLFADGSVYKRRASKVLEISEFLVCKDIFINK